MLSMIDKSKPVFCDTETHGLYGAVVVLQMNQEHWDKPVLLKYPTLDILKELVLDCYTVWHNAHYDLTTIIKATNLTDNEIKELKFADTLLLSRLTWPREMNHSLDDCLDRVLHFDPYKRAGLNKKEMQKSKWGLDITEDQLKYAEIDVLYAEDLWIACRAELDNPSYKLDIETLRSCLMFQRNGLPIDIERVIAYRKEQTEIVDNTYLTINVNSYVQVRELLNVNSSRNADLMKLKMAGSKDAAEIIKVRKARKALSFLDKWLEFRDRIYGKFKPSARSGRLTSDDENLQQLPRQFKGAFGFTESVNRVLVYSDYAQIELRTICAIHGVELMEDTFREGADLHSYVTQLMFGEVTKDKRQLTKSYNFMLLYAGSAKMMVEYLAGWGVSITETQAARDRQKWLSLFPELKRWHQKQLSHWKRKIIDYTPYGRGYVGKLYTDQCNVMNQGFGAEIAKLALIKFINENKFEDVKLCNFIHDSFILDCPDNPLIYKEVSRHLAECMQSAWFHMCRVSKVKIKDLPMPVNVAVGKNWGDIEDGKNIIYELELEPYQYKDADLSKYTK